MRSLESFILDKMAATKLPSVAFAIVKGGEAAYINALGFRDLERGLPATPATIYGIGSITKSFTALCILKLAEEGRLSLDDEVEKYVPVKLRPRGEAVRIRHLLTHTSGLPALGYAEAYIDGLLGAGGAWMPAAKPQDIIPFLEGSDEWAVARPGERFFYLNEGYVLLGMVVEKVTGSPYWDCVKNNILKPLGMTRTHPATEEVLKDADVAKPYYPDPERGVPTPGRIPLGITSDGGLMSSAADMAKYVSMLINRGAYNGAEIISRRAIEEAEKGRVDTPWKLLGDEKYGYGLVTSGNFLGRRLVAHGGNVLVYTAYMAYLPEEKLGVAILANSSGYPTSYIALYALAQALGRDPERELPFLLREKVLKKLEGTYRGYRGTVTYTVKAKGDYLIVRGRWGEELYLLPEEVGESYAKFQTYTRGYKIAVEFHIEKDKVEMLLERYLLVKTGAA